MQTIACPENNGISRQGSEQKIMNLPSSELFMLKSSPALQFPI